MRRTLSHWLSWAFTQDVTRHHLGPLRTLGLVTAILGIITSILILIPIAKERPVSHPVKTRRIKFVRASGASLPTFFADLAPKPDRWQAFLSRAKRQETGTCQHV